MINNRVSKYVLFLGFSVLFVLSQTGLVSGETNTTPPPGEQKVFLPVIQRKICPIPVESGATIVYSGWGDATEQQVNRDAITRFYTLCPGVTVDYQPIPVNYQATMIVKMTDGTAPDVFYLDEILMPAFAPAAQIVALDDSMSQAGVKVSDFILSLTDEFNLNGKTYGLPKDWGTLGLVYLPEAFADAGIAEPTDQWTWNDMRTAAEAIAAKGKYGGFCMAADWARFAPFVFSNGGNFTTSDYKTATLNTSQVEVMATMVSGMKTEGSLKTPQELGAGWCGEALGKKLVSMTLEGTWMIPYMQGTFPNVNYKAVMVPNGNITRADIIFTNALAVNSKTKYPKAAAAFVLFFTGQWNTVAIQNTGFAYSPHPEVISLVSDPIAKAILGGGLLPATKPAYWGPYTGQLEIIVSNALDRVFQGSQTVTQSFDQAQQEATAILAGH